MTLAEIIPIIDSFPHADKFKLIKIILSQIVEEEDISLESHVTKKDDALWDIIGMAEGDDASVARHHDEHLYGIK